MDGLTVETCLVPRTDTIDIFGWATSSTLTTGRFRCSSTMKEDVVDNLFEAIRDRSLSAAANVLGESLLMNEAAAVLFKDLERCSKDEEA